MPTLHLIDASMYIFRAWFSVSDELVDREGWPVNAVHGFTGFLLQLLDQEQPSHVSVAFDESLSTSFRNNIYPPYKANREPAPEALKRQFSHCRAVAEALGMHCMSDNSYEADDLIGSLMWRLRPLDCRHVVVSADKDLSQLLREGDQQWDFARQQRWDHAGVIERYGVHAEQVADYLALTGDAVDNIPGVPGIGAKSAQALLGFFGSLDALLERVEEVQFLSIRGARGLADKLKTHRDAALLARQLTTIATDAPVPEDLNSVALRAPSIQRLDALFDELNFGPMSRRRVREWARRYSD